MKKIKFIYLLIVAFTLSSCSPYSKSDILFEYPEYNGLYYTKKEIKKYKYSDYIVDDVSNGAYKKSTPSQADFKNALGIVDIYSYAAARVEHFKKCFYVDEFIKNHEIELDNMCAAVRDDYFEQKNSYIYYYDLGTKKSTLLSDKLVTNITYDDEMPLITFDVEPDIVSEKAEKIKGRKIMLSDIISDNFTPAGFMKVILGTGKEKHKFFIDREMFDIATSSEISIN